MNDANETPRATWEERWTEQMAATIAWWRDARSMTTQRLAARCTELGLPMKRSVLASLFTQQRRKMLSVQEIAVIARALNVPPLWLLYPVHSGEPVEVLTDLWIDPTTASSWFAGRTDAPWMVPVLGERQPSDLDLTADYEDFARAAVVFQSSNRQLAERGAELAAQVTEGEDLDLAEGDGRFVALLARDTRRALALMRDARAKIAASGRYEPGLPPGLVDEAGWAEPALVPIAPAVDALPGARAVYPLVLVDGEGLGQVGYGAA